MKIKDKLECQNAGPHVAIQVCSDSNDTHTGPILPNTHSQIIENSWPNLSQSQVPNTYPLSPIKPNSRTHKPPTDQLPSPSPKPKLSNLSIKHSNPNSQQPLHLREK